MAESVAQVRGGATLCHDADIRQNVKKITSLKPPECEELAFSKQPEREISLAYWRSIATTARRKNIHPVEVKSGKSLRHVSLDKFMSRFSNWLGEPYLLHTGDLCVKDGILYLPLYMAPFI